MAGFLHEFRKRSFWIATFAEFLATFLFVFLGIGSAIGWDPKHPPSILHIAMCFGLSISTLAMAICHLSGGLINPAVTVALIVTRKISILRGMFFFIAQIVGGIAGAAMLYGLVPSKFRGTLGVNALANGVSIGQAFGVELVLTFLLILTVFACTDAKRSHYGYEVPLAIGFCVTICHIVGIPFTGCGINPARSFGPALIMNEWKNHWIFWVAPLVGGILAALLYELVLRAKDDQLPPTRVVVKEVEMAQQNSHL